MPKKYAANRFKRKMKPTSFKKRAYAKKPRASVRRRLNFGRKKKHSGSMSRAAILDKITVPNYVNITQSDELLAPPSTPGVGMMSNFTTAGNNNPLTSKDPNTMVTIAGILTANATSLHSLRFFQQGFRTMHSITNLSTLSVLVTGYKCMCRKDIPVSGNNPSGRMVSGLLETGIATGSYNVAANATPYMSPDFVSTYKILQTKKYNLKPGFSCKYYVNDKKNYSIRPNDLLLMPNGAFAYDNGTIAKIYRMMAGSVFWMFKLEVVDAQSLIDPTFASGQPIGNDLARLTCLTDSVYTYKFIQDRDVACTSYVNPSASAGNTTFGGGGNIAFNFNNINKISGLKQITDNA